MKTGNPRRETVRVRSRRCRIHIAILTVLLVAGLPAMAEAQQQAPPLTVGNVLELLRSGMPEARILQTIAEACVIQGGDAAVQRQLEQAGASVALRRTSEAFACPEVVTVARVEINAVPTLLVEGQTHRLGVRALDQDGAEVRDRPVRWSSTDPSVVSITSEGEIRGVGPGASQIRAEVDAIVGEVRLIVRGLPAVIDMDMETLTLYVGEQRTLQASVLDRAGNRLVTNLEWFMANPRVASVDGGVILARTPGETTLEISAGSSLRQSVPVVVRAIERQVEPPPPQPVAARIEANPSRLLVDEGETVEVEIRVLAADGARIENPELAWSSSNVAIAGVTGSRVVSARGVVSAQRRGDTRIRASVQGVAVEIPVRVLPARRSVSGVVMSGVIIPGGSQFSMGRTGWGLLTLAAAGGAVAWGYTTTEITEVCRTLPPCQPQDVLSSIEERPNLITGIAIAGAASLLSMIDAGMAASRLNAESDRLRAQPWAGLSGSPNSGVRAEVGLRIMR